MDNKARIAEAYEIERKRATNARAVAEKERDEIVAKAKADAQALIDNARKQVKAIEFEISDRRAELEQVKQATSQLLAKQAGLKGAIARLKAKINA